MTYTTEIKKVKRYTYNIHSGELLEDPEGEWVKLDDITELVRTILKHVDISTSQSSSPRSSMAASGEFKNLLKHIGG
ncbi:MAG: hypothetical protein ACXADW_13590 [Candidatus Hodarchaeales archaeon]|jgi:hypothetical protein